MGILRLLGLAKLSDFEKAVKDLAASMKEKSEYVGKYRTEKMAHEITKSQLAHERMTKTAYEKGTKFRLLQAENGEFYFNLVARNGQVICTSQMYNSKRGRANGLRSFRKNAPIAEVEDLT